MSADADCPNATLTFCSVICTKNIIEPMRKYGVYAFTMFVTFSLAEKTYAYSCGTASETDHTAAANIKAMIVTYLMPFFSLTVSPFP